MELPTTGAPMIPRGRPAVLLTLMAALFVVLVVVLVKGFQGYVRPDVPMRPPAPRSSSASALRDAGPGESWLPQEGGLDARNLNLGGNLAPILEDMGKPLDFTDASPPSESATFRIAKDLARIEPESFRAMTTLCPPVEDLLAKPSEWAGMRLSIRCVPFAVYPYRRTLEGVPRDAWLVYAMPQKTTEQAIVFAALEEPHAQRWTLKRDVFEVDAVFLRLATYESEKKKERVVPYFLARSFWPVTAETAGSSTGLQNLLSWKYGPLIAVAMVALVFFTVWTLRRFSRQTEKLERETFYKMLRTKKRPTAPPTVNSGS